MKLKHILKEARYDYGNYQPLGQVGRKYNQGYAKKQSTKPMKIRQYLKVPFGEKDKAKEMGAKWDPDRKMWYVMVYQGTQFAPGGYEHWLLSREEKRDLANKEDMKSFMARYKEKGPLADLI